MKRYWTSEYEAAYNRFMGITTIRVILHRMPHKPDTHFDPEPVAQAWQRAAALTDLHACQSKEENGVIHVYAADYYAPRSKAK